MPWFRGTPIVNEAHQFFSNQPKPKGVTYDREGPCVEVVMGQRVNIKDGDWVIPEPGSPYFAVMSDATFKTRYDYVGPDVGGA